jgi:hypothetical protein
MTTENIRDTRTTEKLKHHIYQNLNRPEKIMISLVYFKNWRKFVNGSKLNKEKKSFFKIYFKEIHALYYKTVILPSGFVTENRMTRNFLLSRVNENLRSCLSSFAPFNLTSFVNSMRSQIEINALLNKFNKDKDYLIKFTTLNENRRKQKNTDTVVNIMTLIDGLGNIVLPYRELYDEISSLLHPNPSTLLFYIQINQDSPTKNRHNLPEPILKYTFEETIKETETIKKWHNDNIWFFLTMIEDFLMLYGKLHKNIFANNQEKEEFSQYMINELLN